MQQTYLNSEKAVPNLHIHSVTGKYDDSFFGFKFKGNEVHLYYPEAYRLDKNNPSFKLDVLDFLHTISIAKTKSHESNKLNSAYDKEGDFALHSYIWMVKDYLNNGFYLNREKVLKSNQKGRVDWKRTLQKLPIVSNGNVIYNDIIVEVKNSVDNILVEINKYCVKKSIDFIGWLFSIDSRFIEKAPFNNSIKSLYLNVLKKEFEKTFDDYKKERLNHMIKVLEGLDANKKLNEFEYGVTSYHYIFERMIDKIFGTEKSTDDFYPKGSWYLEKNKGNETPSSSLRPDTIRISENAVFIIDSKFYRYGTTFNEKEDLPPTSDIHKQITYGEYISKNNKFKNKEIFNVFIIPYNKNTQVIEENLKYIGYAKSKWKSNSKSYHYIYTFLIDLTNVIKNWESYNRKNDIEIIIEKKLITSK